MVYCSEAVIESAQALGLQRVSKLSLWSAWHSALLHSAQPSGPVPDYIISQRLMCLRVYALSLIQNDRTAALACRFEDNTVLSMQQNIYFTGLTFIGIELKADSEGL